MQLLLAGEVFAVDDIPQERDNPLAVVIDVADEIKDVGGLDARRAFAPGHGRFDLDTVR